MTRIIVTLLVLLSQYLFAQPFEKGMQQALTLWGEGKTSEASALFERIALAEPDEWLPNYYVALVNTTTAFTAKDPVTFRALVDKAQSALDIELKKTPDNPELLVLQGMIHTAWIASDPMTYGPTLSAKAMALYRKAIQLAPDNPRALLSKVEFDFGTAQFMGWDTQSICADVEKALELFSTFKPQSAFYPDWGADRARQLQQQCE